MVYREDMRTLTFVVDARHLTENGGLPTHGSAAKRKIVLTMARYIECGADLAKGHGRETLVECRRRPSGKPCPGLMWVIKNADDCIVSQCLICRHADMVISNWRETDWAEGLMPPEPMDFLASD
jgi:hypothetical protein